MKQPKKLTREQKECLFAHYLNCKDWMLVDETEFYYRIINKNTGVYRVPRTEHLPWKSKLILLILTSKFRKNDV